MAVGLRGGPGLHAPGGVAVLRAAVASGARMRARSRTWVPAAAIAAGTRERVKQPGGDGPLRAAVAWR